MLKELSKGMGLGIEVEAATARAGQFAIALQMKMDRNGRSEARHLAVREGPDLPLRMGAESPP